MKEDITKPLVTLSGHIKKVNLVTFNPTSAHVLASSSADSSIKVWDIQKPS